MPGASEVILEYETIPFRIEVITLDDERRILEAWIPDDHKAQY